MTIDNVADQFAQRQGKLAELRAQGNPFPNDFRRDALAADLHARFDNKCSEELEAEPVPVRIAGRMMSRRVMGKASFAHVRDMSGQIQLFVRKDKLPEDLYAQFKRWDIGDIIGAAGTLFKTKTGELSVQVNELRLLSKALRPLPEKFHGLADQEVRYRQRYLDLIMNEDARRRFKTRIAIIGFLRAYLAQRGFLEVETPMMQAIPGGAMARPFITYHNSLEMDLYLRIAPELYLKRLLVGGFEKVFEINRNFRNEGLSTKHNPEFTMLEFYEAYADYQDAMDLTEYMLRSLVRSVSEEGEAVVCYQGKVYDFSKPFSRLTLRESILRFNPDLTAEQIGSLEAARAVCDRLGITVTVNDGLGKVQTELFEKTVETRLAEPTFITAFPTETSPLARQNDSDPFVTDRFELFIAGREIANGFSELNDPVEQAERFKRQVAEKRAGNEEAMYFDEDFILALEHGMPPAAGVGIGIDRLVMLMTDSASIRDVLLFPHMRPKASGTDAS